MKSKHEAPARKIKHTIRLFMETMTYRVPLAVTKIFVLPDNTSYPICPRCLISLDREYISFCDRCGQKLNWDLFENAKICHPDFKER